MSQHHLTDQFSLSVGCGFCISCSPRAPVGNLGHYSVEFHTTRKASSMASQCRDLRHKSSSIRMKLIPDTSSFLSSSSAFLESAQYSLVLSWFFLKPLMCFSIHMIIEVRRDLRRCLVQLPKAGSAVRPDGAAQSFIQSGLEKCHRISRFSGDHIPKLKCPNGEKLFLVTSLNFCCFN